MLELRVSALFAHAILFSTAAALLLLSSLLFLSFCPTTHSSTRLPRLHPLQHRRLLRVRERSTGAWGRRPPPSAAACYNVVSLTPNANPLRDAPYCRTPPAVFFVLHSFCTTTHYYSASFMPFLQSSSSCVLHAPTPTHPSSPPTTACRSSPCSCGRTACRTRARGAECATCSTSGGSEGPSGRD